MNSPAEKSPKTCSLTPRLHAAKKPCGDCPWRTDVPVGKFPPERYVALAPTAYDMAFKVFACHQSEEGNEIACAGFLARSDHNLTVRMNATDLLRNTSDGGHELFANFRELAVANGVPADHPALRDCRDD